MHLGTILWMNEENKLMGLGHVCQSLELIVLECRRYGTIYYTRKLLDQYRLLLSVVISGVNDNLSKSSMHIPILNPIIGFAFESHILHGYNIAFNAQIYNCNNPQNDAVQLK